MNPFSVAVTGKGGTGKTTVSSLLVRSLVECGRTPVLAVDADPNANLHEALGVQPGETLGSMREEAFTRSIPPGMSRTQYIRLRFRQVLSEQEGYDILTMGRPEGSGCYCFANDLLQTSVRLLEKDYRFLIIDNEAGMEHISRGTIGIPDLLLIVTTPGVRGIRTAARIHELAQSLGLQSVPTGLVFNRYKEEKTDMIPGLPRPLAWIPEDPSIEDADVQGRPVAGIGHSSPAMVAARALSKKIIDCAEKRQ
ncbi:MAG TPA: AAA family ATPase [Methanoregulaceae archaeon]|nr:AAA family ATPase [Methanoregulaceae archaeon]